MSRQAWVLASILENLSMDDYASSSVCFEFLFSKFHSYFWIYLRGWTNISQTGCDHHLVFKLIYRMLVSKFACFVVLLSLNVRGLYKMTKRETVVSCNKILHIVKKTNTENMINTRLMQCNSEKQKSTQSGCMYMNC